MRGKAVRALGLTVGGALAAMMGFMWFASDPLAGLSVAVTGAAMLGWGANRLMFPR